MVRGTPNAAFIRMAILLITWICASTVLCLAFLKVAARPTPRMGVQMESVCAVSSAQEVGVRSKNVKTLSTPAEAALHSPCQAA